MVEGTGQLEGRAPLGRGVQVRADLDQLLQDRQMTGSRRVQQRRQHVVVPRFQGSAQADELRHYACVAARRSLMQRASSVGDALAVEFHACRDEALHGRGVALARRLDELLHAHIQTRNGRRAPSLATDAVGGSVQKRSEQSVLT